METKNKQLRENREPKKKKLNTKKWFREKKTNSRRFNRFFLTCLFVRSSIYEITLPFHFECVCVSAWFSLTKPFSRKVQYMDIMTMNQNQNFTNIKWQRRRIWEKRQNNKVEAEAEAEYIQKRRTSRREKNKNKMSRGKLATARVHSETQNTISKDHFVRCDRYSLNCVAFHSKHRWSHSHLPAYEAYGHYTVCGMRQVKMMMMITIRIRVRCDRSLC